MKTLLSLLVTILLFSACSKQETTPLYKLKLTEDGLNTIDNETLYNQPILSSKLRGYDISIYNMFQNQTTQSLMRVSYESRQIALLIPTQNKQEQTIKSIVVLSKHVINPLKLDIGSPLERKLFATCHRDNELLTCTQNEKSNISWIYKKEPNTRYYLQEIIWSK